MAVALDRSFFDALPSLPEVPKDQGNVAWMVYDLAAGISPKTPSAMQMKLVLHKVVYSAWPSFLAVPESTGSTFTTQQQHALLHGWSRASDTMPAVY